MKINIGNSKSNIKKHQSFKPDHHYVEKAIKDYMKNGGKIKKINIEKENSDQIYSYPLNSTDVDEFLMNP